MEKYPENPYIQSDLLPVDVVFHPSWWNAHAGIDFDADFFYHPVKRVEAEQKMEQVLYDRFGKFGLGTDRHKELPVVGAVHNAAGFLISEMLGCRVEYSADAAPQVIPLAMEKLTVEPGIAFESGPFRRFKTLMDSLKRKYGYVTGDVNWGGVLNVALDLAGEQVLTAFFTDPEYTALQLKRIADVIQQFVVGMAAETGSSSISVNRNVRHIQRPVFLHSECSHTMIDNAQYGEFLMPIDLEWSRQFRPFGIHYCGSDPHRYAGEFARIGNLDFLDVGWGGDVKVLREHLPNTFLNLRLDPVTINNCSDAEMEETVTRLVSDSGNPFLTGVCCINMDDQVEDSKVEAIFRTVEELRKKAIKELNN